MRLPALAVALLVISACSTDLLPRNNHLVGDWGGPRAQLTSDGAKLSVIWDCEQALASGPVFILAGGRFAVDAVVNSLYSGFPNAPVRIRGLVHGDTLTYTQEIFDTRHGIWAAPDTYTVVAGKYYPGPDGCLA